MITENVLENILFIMPSGMREAIKMSEAYKTFWKINEIRIRKNRNISLVCGEKNIILPYKVGESETNELLMRFCKNSLYTYSDTIKEGYIPFDGGVRVGVCGNAVCEDGKITAISDVTSLCVRIPIFSEDKRLSDTLYEHLRKNSFTESVLLFSPPGVGKTTLLRSMAIALSGMAPHKRVALIDSRRELCDKNVEKRENIDIFSGYPKAKGIEIATRTMSPEYIICDEIGSDECESILSLQNSGVPLIAGAHAPTAEKLVSRGYFSRLHTAGVFDIYVKIIRTKSERRELEIYSRDEIFSKIHQKNENGSAEP